MPYAKLTITLPRSVWIGELSRSFPETRFRVLAATANDARGFARVELIGPDVERLCEEIQAAEAVADLVVFDEGPRRRRVLIETTTPLLLVAMQESGVPLDLPIEIGDGRMTLETTIPRKQLSALGEELDDLGIAYVIERIQPEAESDRLLTDRQRWILHEAIERGYYDTPRRITLVELADELDLAKSTCSELLHRTEERVLKRFVNGECEHQPDVPIRAD